MTSQRVLIIAEAGVNHNGSPELAARLVNAAAEAGADAVKFQVFKTVNVLTRSAPKAEYQKRTTEPQESFLEMGRKLELSFETFAGLASQCRERGIGFLASPFDEESLRFLQAEIQVPKIKIASGEITNGPLLLQAARGGRPVILSTGMSNLEEIEAALAVLAFGYSHPRSAPSSSGFREALRSEVGRKALEERVTLLHCTTEYPAPAEEANLRAMATLRDRFGLDVGWSDHTPGVAVAIAAAALGASVIEKHFTLDRTLAGPDHAASLEPSELRALVAAIRTVEVALGSREKRATASEVKNRSVARRSLVAARPIHRGEPFTPENLVAKRPGTGLSPMHFWELLGQTADRDYESDDLILPPSGRA
ncbi:MAG: N-acetylneuraminate synthase [Verrucomicrobia bacterium]|nr:N-acetylneuraminate synthase [Verrucomicrobiota bacterium]